MHVNLPLAFVNIFLACAL